ncbi:unnamed protein product [Pedinophyceae sp. YPF-701]|nr:unnamed protein product [Pedinophyceae sp. YPF-701]
MDGDGGVQLFGHRPAKTRAVERGERREEVARERRTGDATDLADGGGAGDVVGAGGDRGTVEVEHGSGGDVFDTEDDFRSLGVSKWLCNVCRSLGMLRPTEVQRRTIPRILEGRDVIGCAQTGSGKTAAFAIPILQKLAADPFGVFAAVLTPTRELAFQLADSFRALGAGMSLRDCVVVGGLDMQEQARELIKRPHVVVATPGRLAALMRQEPSVTRAFANVRALVLDEADRVLEPTFEDDLATVLAAMPSKGRQLLLFSATITQPLRDLKEIAAKGAYVFREGAAGEGDGAGAALTTVQRLKEQYVFVPARVKEVYLFYLLTRLEELGVRSCIVFAGTCRGCHALEMLLQELDVPAVSLHSNKVQRARLAALDRFRSRLVPILVATDVASRGLDIPTVDLVLNFDLPRLAQDYVHRVGRTARAGRSGWSLSLVSQYEVALVQKIEGMTGKRMEEYEMDEGEVLKGITKVYSARRAASLRLSDLEGSDPLLRRKQAEKEMKKRKKSAEKAAKASKRSKHKQ